MKSRWQTLKFAGKRRWRASAGTTRALPRKPQKCPGHFAHGINFYKLCWVFFICCFLGVVIETVFCFIASGRISQRTGLVWGPFNLIYGFGAVLLTVSLQRLRGKNDRYIFVGGAIIGGAFEYFCSWLQETVTGTVSWDYSGMPFNLNGRINLLYCLFWGVLALVWVKEIYPRISGWIEQNVSRTYGVALTWVIVVFMLLNSLVSGCSRSAHGPALRGRGRPQAPAAADGTGITRTKNLPRYTPA